MPADTVSDVLMFLPVDNGVVNSLLMRLHHLISPFMKLAPFYFVFKILLWTLPKFGLFVSIVVSFNFIFFIKNLNLKKTF